jgi:hypothetical protein
MSAMALDRSQLRRLVVMIPLFAGAAWMTGMFVGTQDIYTLRSGMILAVLIFLSLAVFRLAARTDLQGDTLFWVLMLSFGLKIFAVFFRFASGLLADAYVYNSAGEEIAEMLAGGEWPTATRFSGSFFVRLLTGMVYFVTGPTIVGISIFWAWLGLIGMLFFYKAFVTAFPQGNRRLYMMLVLLFPSMLLWTSSLGKDALMMLAGGLATYGAARSRRGMDFLGILCLLLGIGSMLAIRGHMAAIFTVALAMSLVVRPVRADSMAPFLKVAGLICVAVAAVGIAVVASRLVGLERLDVEEVQGFIGERQGFTGQTRRVLGEGEHGGSAFKPIDTSSPLGLAILIPTVLFRPFPWEAHNANAMITAVESLGLLALIVYRRRSVTAALLGSPRSSFLLLSVLYALMFIYIFSAVANFGIIARQRVQIFPYVFMWIAYLGARRPAAEGSGTMTVATGSR